jgi:hypothetical protein
VNDKIIKIQQELKVPKNQTNSFGGYKYRSCEDILEELKPHLKKEGLLLTMSDEVVNIGDRNYVKASIQISDGTTKAEWFAYAREDEARKGMSGDQITGAASSYARKYCLNGIFLIDDTKDSDSTNDGKEDKKAPVATTEGNYGVCKACGAPNKWSANKNKAYCGNLCWKNPDSLPIKSERDKSLDEEKYSNEGQPKLDNGDDEINLDELPF